ncbi:site-specific integrase [Shewanella algae]|uniref:tyrosine-type recombinase/integrase n=1 Tax=Shewanella algae TaxID=38313 RepID=UPI001AAC853F|nr:site-specific integrase [Shewanella algae]MBO2626657.1 site-specific integrase [Shewanella algae]
MAKQLERHPISDDLYIFLQDNSHFWYARFKVAGKWLCKATKQKEKDKAIHAAYRLLMEYQIRSETGTLVTSKRFRDAADKAIQFMQSELDRGTGKANFRDYIIILNKYHIPFFDGIHISTIDMDKLREFDAWRIQQLKRVPAKSTILNHNAAMQMVFQEAVAQKWMLPGQIPSLSTAGVEAKRRAAFTPEEYARVYDTVVEMQHSSRKEITRQIRELLSDYMEFAIHTGMRPGTELDNLTWGDLHIERKGHRCRFSISVRKGKTTKHTGTREVVCKAGLHDTILQMTLRFKDRKATDKLFRLRDGNTTRELGRHFDRAVELAGLKDSNFGSRTLYSLRHSYITWELVAQNVTIDVLAKQCGTSIQMIEQHYSHVIPRMFSKELSGVDLPDPDKVIAKFEPLPDKSIKYFERKYAEWENNYKSRGCI